MDTEAKWRECLFRLRRFLEGIDGMPTNEGTVRPVLALWLAASVKTVEEWHATREIPEPRFVAGQDEDEAWASYSQGEVKDKRGVMIAIVLERAKRLPLPKAAARYKGDKMKQLVAFAAAAQWYALNPVKTGDAKRDLKPTDDFMLGAAGVAEYVTLKTRPDASTKIALLIADGIIRRSGPVGRPETGVSRFFYLGDQPHDPEPPEAAPAASEADRDPLGDL